jgi:hypothetical protein
MSSSIPQFAAVFVVPGVKVPVAEHQNNRATVFVGDPTGLKMTSSTNEPLAPAVKTSVELAPVPSSAVFADGPMTEPATETFGVRVKIGVVFAGMLFP